ncbi:5'-3' exonuclease [Pseudomonas syringae pv. actinidiae]|uniref:5'-3' exonuclease n=1 Tax=Pseudomonas syringae pv. actinidiae TaxID=103796 RepID=A0AAN4TJJ5_PSESF|nr:5'-3' exonuclease [Pseudomonas syringae pv. actinidiae]
MRVKNTHKALTILVRVTGLTTMHIERRTNRQRNKCTVKNLDFFVHTFVRKNQLLSIDRHINAVYFTRKCRIPLQQPPVVEIRVRQDHDDAV